MNEFELIDRFHRIEKTISELQDRVAYLESDLRNHKMRSSHPDY